MIPYTVPDLVELGGVPVSNSQPGPAQALPAVKCAQRATGRYTGLSTIPTSSTWRALAAEQPGGLPELRGDRRAPGAADRVEEAEQDDLAAQARKRHGPAVLVGQGEAGGTDSRAAPPGPRSTGPGSDRHSGWPARPPSARRPGRSGRRRPPRPAPSGCWPRRPAGPARPAGGLRGLWHGAWPGESPGSPRPPGGRTGSCCWDLCRARRGTPDPGPAPSQPGTAPRTRGTPAGPAVGGR